MRKILDTIRFLTLSIQADLDEFMIWYNTERTNQGKYCQGRTPMETFLAGIDLYQRFVYDNEEVMEEAA